jgi:hypothetical protein
MGLEMEQLQVALSAEHELEAVEFKETFDPSSTSEWCELLKDVFAIVNSGGGFVLFGVRNDGTAAPGCLDGIANLDPAKLTDQVAAYTAVQYSAFRMTRETRDGAPVVVLRLNPSQLLLVPRRPGSYPIGNGKQATAFGRGVVLFRHGAKSEPGDAFDVERFIDRRVRQVRRVWLSGVRRVVTAPTGSVVSVTVRPPSAMDEPAPNVAGPVVPGPTSVRETEIRVSGSDSAPSVRITTDPNAPAFRLVTPDESHPYRTMEFLDLLNRRLAPLSVRATTHDLRVLCEEVGPEVAAGFCYHPRHGPRQYSAAFADWIHDRVLNDRTFLSTARARHRSALRWGRAR